MIRGFLFVLVLFIFFPSLLCLGFDPVDVAAPIGYRVHNVDTGLDYTTIQGAIDAPETENGHTIFVDSGIYYEHVVVDKALALVGDGNRTTIVDGNGTGTVIKISANSVTLNGFTVQNSGSEPGTSYAGVKISGHMFVNITGNHVTRNKIGIFVTSQGSRITENNVTNNGQGIALYDSSEVVVEANAVTANTVGISLALSFNNLIVDNSATNSSSGGHGITLSSNSFNNTIFSNDLTNNYHGMWLSSSSNNRIVENNLADNKLLGIELASSPGNTIYYNNFINNSKHVVSDKQPNTWDYGFPSGGNYWSESTGVDLFTGPDQNETGSDGIQDNVHFIDENNRDNYPLAGMSHDFNADSGYCVRTISNSSVSAFQFNGTAITFNVSGENRTIGFCRIRIPTTLMNGTYRVFVNGTEAPHILLTFSNSTHSYLYFDYCHSTKGVVIIPEFPLPIILLSFMISTLLAIMVVRLLSPCDL